MEGKPHTTIAGEAMSAPARGVTFLGHRPARDDEMPEDGLGISCMWTAARTLANDNP